MPKFSANLSILFTEHAFLDRFEAASRAGFKATEFWFPYDWPVEDIASRLDRYSLKCLAINTPPGDMALGEWGVGIFPSRKQEFEAGVRLAINYAVALHCEAIHVMAGIVPSAGNCSANGRGGLDDEDFSSTYVRNIAYACRLAKAARLAVLIEPLNPFDRPGYYLQTMAQAHDIVASIGESNLLIMMDLYHVQMTEGNVTEKLRRYLPQIGHIQIADVPGRHEPGTGELNYDFILREIDRLQYGGWVGCEYGPLETSASSLGWAKPYARVNLPQRE